MIRTRKLVMIGEEEILRNSFDFRKLYEEKVLVDLKRSGYKFIKWEWKHEIRPSTDLALIVTYEVKEL